MPYNDGKIWDSKRGWVRPKRNRTKMGRIIIERKIPKMNLGNDKYDDAPINFDWYEDPNNPNHDWKVGYTKETTPQGNLLKYNKDLKKYELVNFFLKLIPWIKVKEVKEDTTKNPFTRRD